ncbi:hypothetical protein [Amycolatopsis acidiphila]|uniref:hypothetical protein n=1 Tax=Amycolatopsis acidiphila TaxID=715473 RepID=UPI00402BD777
MIESTEFFRGTLTERRRDMLVANTRTKRAGTVDDAADLVGFLAGPGTGHLTGQAIHLNGGAHLGR